MTLSLIGAGFGRTGTLSLKYALEQLGLSRCYHMMEVAEHPEHVALWRGAADGRVNWDTLFAGYRATVDWPACSFWRPLTAHYPKAKVLLTERDPERWYKSAHATIYQAMTRPLPEDHPARPQREMAIELILAKTFGGRFADKNQAISVYERHNEEVKKSLLPERLLVYRVSEGWEPLCAFLGLAVPDDPFPHVNSSEEFRERFRIASGAA